MKGNLSFKANENTIRASVAANCILQKSNSIYSVICGIDSDTGDVLFFFPIDFLDGYSEEEQEKLTQKLSLGFFQISRFSKKQSYLGMLILKSGSAQTVIGLEVQFNINSRAKPPKMVSWNRDLQSKILVRNHWDFYMQNLIMFFFQK